MFSESVPESRMMKYKLVRIAIGVQEAFIALSAIGGGILLLTGCAGDMRYLFIEILFDNDAFAIRTPFFRTDGRSSQHRYVRYALSYRDLEEIMLERGLHVDLPLGPAVCTGIGAEMPSSPQRNE